MRFCTISCLILSCLNVGAEIPNKFVRAIHQVESSGRVGLILGDFDPKTGKHLALGPLQIHRGYHADSGVKGSYLQCTNLDYSIKVMEGYFKRYCPKALKEKNLEVLAKIHNGGFNGPNVRSTQAYWRKVQKHLK